MNWIDVFNDRMPDHNGVVLCCNANDEDSPICLGVQVRDGDTEFYIFEIDQKSDKVTHWMELPEKPKSELASTELINRK
jgi:dTDP-glucose pyrophosphorylase